MDSHFKCNTLSKKIAAGSPVAQALARGIVVGLNHLRKPLLRDNVAKSVLRGMSSPQPDYGVLHPSLLPGV